MDVLQGSYIRVHDGGERDDYVFEAENCYYGPRLPTPQEALAGANVDYWTSRPSGVLYWGELHPREIRVHQSCRPPSVHPSDDLRFPFSGDTAKALMASLLGMDGTDMRKAVPQPVMINTMRLELKVRPWAQISLSRTA